MASNKHSNTDITRFLAFIALLLSIVILTLEMFTKAFGWKWGFIGTLSMIKEISLLIVVCLAAYPFACSLGKTWRLVYWFCVVIVVVMFILGRFVV